MKITGLETFVLRCSLPKDWSFPVASFVEGGSVFLKITTDEGIFGWGEPSPYGALPISICEVLHSGIRELIIGKDPHDVASITRQEEARGEHLYGKAAWNAALAGVSQALWDILGKYENKPVFRLLNPGVDTKDKVRAYASGGMIFADASRSFLVEEALKAKAAGYTAWKFRPPTPLGAASHFQRNLSPPGFDSKDLMKSAQEIRLALGDDFELMLDAGCRIPSVPEAILIGDCLSELHFSFFEEPIPRVLENYSALADRLDVPVAIGECFFSYQQFEKWLNGNAVDVLQPDANFAGVSEIMRIATLARDAQKPVVLHNWASAVSIAANVHLAAALPECSLLEFNLTFNPLRTELVDQPFVPRDGSFILTEKPGLGIDVNESTLRRYST